MKIYLSFLAGEFGYNISLFKCLDQLWYSLNLLNLFMERNA